MARRGPGARQFYAVGSAASVRSRREAPMKPLLEAAVAVLLAAPLAAQTPCGPRESACGIPGVTIGVSPACATPGQLVEITLRNESSETITLPTGCVYLGVWRGSGCGGAPVQSPGCTFALVPLDPGVSFTHAWSQTDDLGAQVPPGTYSLEVWYWDAAFANLFQCCVEVTLASACPDASVRNGSGANPVTLASLQPPRLGSAWSAGLDCSGHAPGQAYLFVHDAPAAGTFHRFGEVLVGGRQLLGLTQPHAGSLATFTAQVPPSLALCGRRTYAQGLCSGAPRPRLSNALDLLLWR